MSKARERLSEQFISALEADYLAHGDVALERVRRDEPKAYLRLVADLTPKQQELKIETHDYDSMSVTELRELVIEGLAGAIEQQIAADLPRFEKLVREARKAQRKGEIPPNGYSGMSAGDRWRTDHGRKPKLVAVDTD